MEEIAGLVRCITNAKQVQIDAVERLFTVHARPDQFALAEWLFDQLENPAGPTEHPYRIPDREDSVDNTVRLFHLAHAPTVHDLWEMATLIDLLEDLRFVSTCAAQNVIALRGTPERLRGAEWLVRELDRPPEAFASDPGAREYRSDADPDFVIRIFYAPRSSVVAQLQELGWAVRASGNTRRVFVTGGSKALALRAPPEQVSLAAWLVQNLTHASDGDIDYVLSEPDQKVRIFRLSSRVTPNHLTQLEPQLRAATRSLYIMPLPSYKVQSPGHARVCAADSDCREPPTAIQIDPASLHPGCVNERMRGL